MFDFVAKNKRLIQLILGLLILPFAFFGLDYYTRASRGSAHCCLRSLRDRSHQAIPWSDCCGIHAAVVAG